MILLILSSLQHVAQKLHHALLYNETSYLQLVYKQVTVLSKTLSSRFSIQHLMEWFNAAIAGDLKYIKANVDVYEKSTDKYFDNKTALMQAAEHNKIEVVQFLIPYEAGMQSKKGNTALHFAVINNSLECILPLIPAEAKLKNKNGKTAEELAVDKNNYQIIDIFKNYNDQVYGSTDIHIEFDHKDEESLIDQLKNQQLQLQAQIKQQQIKSDQLDQQMQFYNNQYVIQHNVEEEEILKDGPVQCGQYNNDEIEQEKLHYLQNELNMVKSELGELKGLIKQLVEIVKARNTENSIWP